eukprot:CAMPEP_0115747768 /NCGR_PEP_ID=MMETSP0272-20121206/93332_1 /TAXON_ID=71861 /ORGANISM="Scrippsiella trochoidea, Strain CCMP3099" /LENGTH=111 /DNA_ID=CAMNT_0003192769 /DNA_START=164 /DNA_END=497 /DNA_ORIENTATION=+
MTPEVWAMPLLQHIHWVHAPPRMHGLLHDLGIVGQGADLLRIAGIQLVLMLEEDAQLLQAGVMIANDAMYVPHVNVRPTKGRLPVRHNTKLNTKPQPTEKAWKAASEQKVW